METLARPQSELQDISITNWSWSGLTSRPSVVYHSSSNYKHSLTKYVVLDIVATIHSWVHYDITTWELTKIRSNKFISDGSRTCHV